MLIFSAILQMGLLLPMVETFHRVTFAGVGLNALAIPVMTVVLALALPINLLSVLSPVVAAWPAKALTLVMAALFGMTHLPGLSSWLSYRAPGPPIWVACGFCTAFVIAGLTLRFAKPAAVPAMAACAVFVVLVAGHPFAPRLPQGILQFTVLDCSPGESQLLVTPGGATVLIDAGNSPTPLEGEIKSRHWSPGEEIVSPYLWSLGIKKIDVLVFTQASSRQLGGLYAMLANFQVGEFWHGAQPETAEYTRLLETLAKRGIPTRTLSAGDVLSVGGASIRVLWPAANTPVELPMADERSLALSITAGRASLMLTGETSTGAAKSILASNDSLASQLLSIPGRGWNSPPQGQLLRSVSARVAIVTSAPSRFGAAPQGEALGPLAGLGNAGTKIFRTDLSGSITAQWKDGTLRILTFARPQSVMSFQYQR